MGQDNLRRYCPVREIRIRLHPDDSFFDLYARVAAAKAVGCRITVSSPPDARIAGRALLEDLTEPWAGAIEFVEESEAMLAEVVRRAQTDRVRYAALDRVPPEIFAAAAGERPLPGAGASPRGGSHRAPLVPEGAEHQLRLSPLRQPRRAVRRAARGGALRLRFSHRVKKRLRQADRRG